MIPLIQFRNINVSKDPAEKPACEMVPRYDGAAKEIFLPEVIVTFERDSGNMKNEEEGKNFLFSSKMA